MPISLEDGFRAEKRERMSAHQKQTPTLRSLGEQTVEANAGIQLNAARHRMRACRAFRGRIGRRRSAACSAIFTAGSHPIPKIGKIKRRNAIAPIGRTQNRVQSLVLHNWHRLAMTHRPTLRRIIKSEPTDLTDIKFHSKLLLIKIFSGPTRGNETL